jgi:transcriptional regulator with XRE-family HTH domain
MEYASRAEELWERIKLSFQTENAAEIARKLGIERQSVYKWRDGKNLPSLETFERMSQLTGRSQGWLITGLGAPYFQGNTLIGDPDDHIYDYIHYGLIDENLRDRILAIAMEEEDTPGGENIRYLMEEWVREGFHAWLQRRNFSRRIGPTDPEDPATAKGEPRQRKSELNPQMR